VAGAKVLKATVLGPRGAFVRLCTDLGPSRRAVKFGPSTIHVFTGADGAPIDDVLTTADGDALAQRMLDIVRRICSDKDATVHAIASGGRKVMSLYLNAMMQIAGRPEDKLFHLLVHPAIERQIVDKRRRLDYFYPRGAVRIDGQTIPEQDQLAYIEIPLLTITTTDTLKRNLPWAEIVRLRKREAAWGVAPPPLTVDPRTLSLRIGDVEVRLQPRQFFWYYSVARLGTEGYGPLPAGALARALEFEARGQHRFKPDVEDAARLQEVERCLRAYHHALFPRDGDEFSAVLKGGLEADLDGLRGYMSKAKRQLKGALGAASRTYEARARRGTGEYSIGVSPDDIRILAGPAPRRPPPLT